MISLEFEQKLWEQGIQWIAFCDEVGRGPLLGSVVAAAVVLPVGLFIEGVNDSKKLTPGKREALQQTIGEQCIALGIGEVDNQQIDQINIRQASRLAMKKAVLNLQNKDGQPVKPDYLLIDAETIDLEIPQQAIIHGDALCHGIAAASIMAKVFRDTLCLAWDQQYPHYGIASHKGYSTRAHMEALLKLGPTPLHRHSFIRKILARAKEQQQILFK